MNILIACLVFTFAAAPSSGVPVRTQCPTPDPADYHSADTDDCHIFYKCNYGAWYQFTCQNLVFNPQLSVCDYPENYPCDYNRCFVLCDNGVCTSGVCQCDPGYEGQYCDTDIDECARGTDNCSVGYTCSNTNGSFTCTLDPASQCGDGYDQDPQGNCIDINECTSEADDCADVCINTVGSFACACQQGYQLAADGRNCELLPVVECTPACQNGGTCVPSGAGNFCDCAFGFTGIDCSQVDICAPVECQNDGQCYVSDGQARCECDISWTGPLCETPTGIEDPCKTNPPPCLNGGICDSRTGAALCYCTAMYYGTYCENLNTRTNTECTGSTLVCLNGGQCTEVNGSPECLCTIEYTGTTCEILAANAACAGFYCGENQECVVVNGEPECQCQMGFSGPGCQDFDVCVFNPCQFGGICQTDANGASSCQCPEGRTGYFCELEVTCDSMPCLNGGECIITINAAVCVCPPGTSGDNCERREHCGLNNSPCMNGGECCDSDQGYVCSCPFGFTGAACEKVRTCADGFITCDNGGTCVDSATEGASCQCAAGFTGPYCETVLDDCGGCQNGGVCKIPEIYPADASVDLKSCACPQGYIGEFCEEPAECTVPCHEDVGKDGARYEAFIFPDPLSQEYINVCKAGLVQRVLACPGSIYNIYTSNCLTPTQYAQYIQASSDAQYPPPGP